MSDDKQTPPMKPMPRQVRPVASRTARANRVPGKTGPAPANRMFQSN